MFCNDSSNVIRQCNNIVTLSYLTFVRTSHIKKTLETNAQTHIFASCVARNNLDFTRNQKAITHFLQHTFVRENFVYFDVAHSEFSSNKIVTYELTEISLIRAF